MVALMAAASDRLPTLEPILICRYSEDDVLRVDPAVYGHWLDQLRAALRQGWDVDHLRSEIAWKQAMSQPADEYEPGGPISLLSRLGLSGDYRPHSVPASGDRAARLNLVDVPGVGALLHAPSGLGCFLPERENLRPLRETLREEALALADATVPLLTIDRSERPPTSDGPTQSALRRLESQKGEQVFVKDGLNIVLQPTEQRSAVLGRLRVRGYIDEGEEHYLVKEHELRRQQFLDNLETYRCMDICLRSSLHTFVTNGTFTADAANNVNLTPVERSAFLMEVAQLLNTHDNYSLVLVDAAPINVRFLVRACHSPFVCIWFGGMAKGAQWATVRERTFCKATFEHLRRWHDNHLDIRAAVHRELVALAQEARSLDVPDSRQRRSESR